MTTSMTPERNRYLRRVLGAIFERDLREDVQMTRRQEEVARTWLAAGSYEEAGRRLGITGQAVMMHVQRLALRAERAAPDLSAATVRRPDRREKPALDEPDLREHDRFGTAA